MMIIKEFITVRKQMGLEHAFAHVVHKVRMRIKKFFFREASHQPISLRINEIYRKHLPFLTPIETSTVKRDEVFVYLLIPTINEGSLFAGAATALHFAMNLSLKKTAQLRIVCTDAPGEPETLKRFYDDNGYSQAVTSATVKLVNVHDRTTKLELSENDFVISTIWWTAWIAQRHIMCKNHIYMVQEYEPIFYSNGDQKLLVESTYTDLNTKYVVNSSILHNFLLSKRVFTNNQDVSYFEPALDRSVFNTQGRTIKKKQRLFFYARPAASRNLYLLGLAAINQIFNNNVLPSNDWEVILAGEELDYRVVFDSNVDVIHLGKLSFEQYGHLTKTIDLALSLMDAPHPSYPPLELAAAGAKVITTSYEFKTDLSQYNNLISLAEKNIESIVDCVKAAIKSHKTTSLDKPSLLSTDWESSFRSILENLT